MRRFNVGKEWTKDAVIKFSKFIQQATDETDKYSGFMFPGFTHLYAGKLMSPAIFWQGVGVGFQNNGDFFKRIKPSSNKKYAHGFLFSNLFSEIVYYNIYKRDEGKPHINDISFLSEDDINNKYSPWAANSELTTAALNNLMTSEKYKDSYSGIIEALNFVDLNCATAKAVRNITKNKGWKNDKLHNKKHEHTAAIAEYIEDAIRCMEESCAMSKKNSNISGDMYEQLLKVRDDIKAIAIADEEKVLEGMNAKLTLALDLDKLDNIAVKYLNYKAETGHKPNAIGKLKAAIQIREIVRYCYGEEKDIKVIKDMTAEKINNAMDEFKGRQVAVRNSGHTSYITTDPYFITEEVRRDIFAKEITHDSSLQTLVNAEKAKQNPAVMQM